MCKAENLLC